MDPGNYAVEAVMRNGFPVRIRSIRPDDKHHLLEGFHRLSERSVFYRFFQAKHGLTEEELRYFTEVDFVRHVALVAVLPDNGERIVGVGRYVTLDDPQPPLRAEVALTVDDEHQGLGIGTLLLEHLVQIARAAGIAAFEAEIMAENRAMLDLLAHVGFQAQGPSRRGVVHVRFPID